MTAGQASPAPIGAWTPSLHERVVQLEAHEDAVGRRLRGGRSRGEGEPEHGERAPHRAPLSSRASVSTTPGGSRRQFPSGFAGSSFFWPQ
jgi:hypothetical protein